MTFAWDYPLFLIRTGGGFASVAIASEDGRPRFAVVVFTSPQRAEQFLETTALDGEIWPLETGSDFARLLAGLRPPFLAVAFDSAPLGAEVNARWTGGVAEILVKHFPETISPWPYPVFVLEEEEGLASIEGDVPGRGRLVALALFTSAESAEGYRAAADLIADRCTVGSPAELARLLRSLPSGVSAVAIDPTAADGRRAARACVEISVLLEKYLPDTAS